MTVEQIQVPVIEHRTAGVAVESVDFAQRLITVVVVPYDQPAKIEYRSEIWDESFMRGSLDGCAAAPHRVRANRSHNADLIVGKATQFWPDRDEGLVGEIRIAKTPLGDETLHLADEDMISASVGFGVRPVDQVLDRRSMTRRIKKAYLDHVAFVQTPAYDGARVLAVRDTTGGEVAGLQPIHTPFLDELASDELLRWASERLD